MADRDWDKELAKVDKHLAALSDSQLEALANQAPVPTKTGSAVSKPVAKAAAPRSAPSEPKATSSWGVYARLGLSVLLGVGMVIWPYEVRCGVGLFGYLAAVVVVVTSGVWSSVWTWRHRASRAHALSLLIVLWGLVLGSLEILPRIGYAKPDVRHPATWTCVAPAAPAPTPAPTPKPK
jgi:hypothetical protein